MSASCQIAVEGCEIYLYRDRDGEPEESRGVLFVLVPIVHHFFEENEYDGERLMAEIATGMALSSQAFVLKRAERNSSASTEVLVETFERTSTVQQKLSANSRDADWHYIIRANQYIEVYEGKTYKDFPDDIALVDLSRADRIVVPEAKRSDKRVAVN